MKPFARFHSEKEHKILVEKLIRERFLRESLEQLMYFRGKGITTMSGIEDYISKAKKSQQANIRHIKRNFSNKVTVSMKPVNQCEGFKPEESKAWKDLPEAE